MNYFILPLIEESVAEKLAIAPDFAPVIPLEEEDNFGMDSAKIIANLH